MDSEKIEQPIGDSADQPTKPSRELPAATPQFHTPAWMIILLLYFFLPGAGYFMWRERRYYNWLPTVLWIYGGLIAAFAALYQFIVIPQLTALYQKANLLNHDTSDGRLVIVVIVFALAQVAFGVFLKRKLQATGQLPRGLMWVVGAMLMLDYLLSSFIPQIVTALVTVPIYNSL